MSSTPCPSPSRSTEEKDKDSMWYFSADQLANSPSRQNGITADMELSYRQQTAYLIQEMGQRLQVSQLCINTAIVYMHRFYAFHSFTHFHRNRIAAASLFLAAKVEEQPRKLEHVIKAANKCLNHATSATTDAHYIEQAQDLVFNENVLLQTLGFDVAIDHPHTHVVKTCQLVKACKDLAQTSYFLASNSLHLTSMCLQYKPTVVACFCIYLACKWSRWEIAQSTEGKHWFHYVDETVTMDLLKQLTDEFIAIYEKSPARLKSKLNNIKAIAQRNQAQVKDKKADQDWKMSDMMKMYSPGENQASSSQYTTTSQPSASNDQSQQSGQSIPPAMLPPQSHQPQPIRKTETHRSHHNSSTSSSHHPPKVGYSTGDNVLDHKSNSHKQQQQPVYNSNNLVNRTRDPSSAHTNQNLMLSSKNAVSRSGQMSGNLVGQSIPRAQAHPFDVNLHKARERNLTGVSISAGHGLTSHGMPPRKPDATRSLTKDSSLRVPPEQLPKVAGSNSKVFSTSSMSSLPYAGGQQMHSSTKVDVMHDMCRNVIQGSSRGHSNATANGPTPPAGYHQSQMPRHTNTKHEQPKQMSVHTQQQPQVPMMHHQHPFQQPQQQLQQHHHHHHNKPLIKTEPSFAGSSGANDLSQASQMQPYGNQRSSVEPALHSDEHVPSQFNAHLAGSGGGSQPQNFVKSTNSLFSPDYVEKSQLQQQSATHQMSLNSSNLNGVTSNSDVYNYKMTSATSGVNAKDSPTKVKMEREQNSRKDKNRNNLVNTEPPAMSRSSNQPATQTFMKNSVAVKSEPSALTLPNELSGTSSYHNMAAAAMKRPNDQLNIKQEDELLRENKVRKMEHMNDMGKHHQVVNGIETNPDLVRNLLKESLCSTSGLLKSQSLAPSLQPPAELLEPSTSAAASQQMNTISTAANTNAPTNNGKGTAMDVDEQGPSGAKAEKKKKKDKHKHKEKDKTKDREERKKHKKDKDRHKEREADGSAEHVKIKISKEKIENAAGEPIGLKIKIPKDIIAGDLTSNTGNLALSNSLTTGDMQATVTHAPQPLKIKISKDKLESYSSGSTNDANNLSNAQHQHGHPKSLLTNYPAYNSTHANPLSTVHGSNSSSTNATKRRERDRDRDRERDKEKKRSHDSSVKSGVNSVPQATAAALLTTTGGGHQILPTSNTVAGAPHCFGSAVGGGGVGVGIGTGVGSAINATAQRNQYSSKMHHHNNMSQLFGESNDDDDDDDDDY